MNRFWKALLTVSLLAIFLITPALAQTEQTEMKDLLRLDPTASLRAQAGVKEAVKITHRYHVECVRDGKIAWVEDVFNRTTTVGLNLYLTNNLKGGTGAPWYVGIVGPDYGSATGVITGTTTLTDSGNSPFVAGDTGQPITIKGAGAAGADLNTTMTYSSSTVVTLGNAGTNGTYQYLFGARLADTMASHSPWTEVTPYSNANRPTWTGGTVASGSVDNSASPAAFIINASATVYGMFMADNNGKGGSTGNLLGMAPFSASRAVLSGDTLNVTITCSIS